MNYTDIDYESQSSEDLAYTLSINPCFWRPYPQHGFLPHHITFEYDRVREILASRHTHEEIVDLVWNNLERPSS